MAEEVLLILQFSHCKISSRAELLPYQEQQPSGPYLDARAGEPGERGVAGRHCVLKWDFKQTYLGNHDASI